MSVHKNQTKFEWRPIRKQYFEIWIDFQSLTPQKQDKTHQTDRQKIWTYD